MKTDSGKNIPLNIKPRKDGNIVLRAGKAVVISEGVETTEAEHKYVSHFATCPSADTWRKT